MSVIVTDKGFVPSPDLGAVSLAEFAPGAKALDLANTDDPTVLEGKLDGIEVIRVAFPAFSDGRAFTIARRLRMMGYKGQIWAHGHIIADQYAMARRVGFDGAEISDELAARQPWEQWQSRADWRAHDYQARLRA